MDCSIRVQGDGNTTAFAFEVQLAAVLPVTTQTNHLSVAGASEVGLQTIKGCYFPLCLIFDTIFRDFLLYRLEIGLVDHHWITVFADVAGVFEDPLYLVLVPERCFGGKWDILPIQRI